LIYRYIRYLLQARDEHAIHSPFVFELYTEVIRSKEKYYAFATIEGIRTEMLESNQRIEIVDLGAGSRIQKKASRKVGDIARYAEKNTQFGQLLFRLVNYFAPKTIFDLGTSLGITTLYFGAACPKGKIYTFEGCPETARIARQNFSKLHYNHIELVEGNLDMTLQMQLREIEQIDFAFFDANHRYEPTVAYFQFCLSKATEQSVFVFDDIHWSAEMEQAWQYIRHHPQVTLTIDLFFIGIVFFRSNQPKQHFVLRI
jgi:predicted O-methyltransferase YrrM